MSTAPRRVSTLAAGIAVGAIGAVVFASAAQACHTEFKTEPAVNCTDTGWTVTWEVTDWNSDRNEDGTISEVVVNAGELTGEIVAGAVLPAFNSGETLSSTQTLSFEDDFATIDITATWPSDTSAPPSSQTVSKPAECEPTDATPPAEPEPEITAGGWSECSGIQVTAGNKNPEALAEFKFVSSAGEEVTGTPEAGEEFTHFFLIEEAAEELSVDIFADGELVDTIEWYDNELCSYIQVEADCEGLIVTLSVPQDGEATTFELATSLNDEVTEIVLQPGDSETYTFKAEGTAELWVDYTIGTKEDATGGGVQWIPCDVETASPSPSETPSAQETLDVTGSSMTIMLSSAAALIVAAAAIFLLMRRRRAAQDW